MSTMTSSNEVVFRTFQQYKKYFAPSPEIIDYTGKSEEYIWASEAVRKAFDETRRRMEAEKKMVPWEKTNPQLLRDSQ